MNEYMGMFFEWDTDKEKTNKRKHGIDFDEAMTAFGDIHQHVYFDEKHSDDEDRFILIGYSEKRKLLILWRFVCITLCRFLYVFPQGVAYV